MYIKKKKAVSVFVPLLLSMSAANAVPVPGGTQDPLNIPKYVTPLVIPPVMNNAAVTDPTRPAGEYDIAVRKFKQQILPQGFSATTVWSYGPAADKTPTIAPDINSQFNYPAYTIEATKDVKSTVFWMNELIQDPDACKLAGGPASGDPACKFLPPMLSVDQTLHWANPAADCESGELRTDCAGTTDAPYAGPVPMVTHLHGAHVGGSGDGYTEAWTLPNASDINCIPRDLTTNAPVSIPDPALGEYVCEGTLANQLTNKAGFVVNNITNGVAKFGYPNDQPSTTLWYHDHSLGMTRTNVYSGPAGFYLIRDPSGASNETGLTLGSVLPGPAPVAGEDLQQTNFNFAQGGEREKYREIPIVIQGRSFNDDGSLFYPDNRAFFEGLNVEGTALTNPQFPGAPELQIPLDGDPAVISDIAPLWNPEAFFNTMVVNGKTWPEHEVAPAQYRFRLLNGSNSRFLNLALMITDALGNPISVDKTVWFPLGNGNLKLKTTKVTELDFFQIGAEQSLSPTVSAIRTGFATQLTGKNAINKLRKVTSPVPAPDPQQALLMGLAERSDVIVDFRGLPDGTIITMTNTAPDTPFGGFPDVPADPATTGQVMRFVVNSALLGASPTDEDRDPITGVVLNPLTAATNVEDLVVDPLALDNFTVALTNPVPRELALVEEESTLICADVDLAGNVVQIVGYLPVAGACEDALGNVHPTALPFAPKAAVLGTVDAAGIPTVTLWSDPIVTNVNADGTGTQTAEQWNLWNFTVDGHPIHIHLVKFKVLGRTAIGGGASVINTATGAQAWENGWKDTVITYPGEVTSVAADFDINGLYVWHCHILEHEDNEMMTPFCVGKVDPLDNIQDACPTQLF